jgi:hypothetical protein
MEGGLERGGRVCCVLRLRSSIVASAGSVKTVTDGVELRLG